MGILIFMSYFIYHLCYLVLLFIYFPHLSDDVHLIFYIFVLDRCDCFDHYEGLIPYKEAWSWQKSVVRMRQTLVEREEDHSDTLIILQHQPVYTLGTRSLEKFVKFDIKNSPYDLYQTERGGEVTYHGPGQVCLLICSSFFFLFVGVILLNCLRE